MTTHRWRAFAVLAVAYFMTIGGFHAAFWVCAAIAALAVPIAALVIPRRTTPQLAPTVPPPPALATSGR